MAAKRLLITGATGKVGTNFLRGFFDDPRFESFTVRALCHNRLVEPRERLEVLRGSIANEDTVREAMDGVTHVLHLATVKETPQEVMDVAVKGMFWLLETCRVSPTFEQFILLGGDNVVGHCLVPHAIPITETQPHTPYPGCYALSKVLEEVMLEQYYLQYNLNGCCLRAPWIMEKDDFKAQVSFGEDVFGGFRWREHVGVERADEYVKAGTVAQMLDEAGKPIKRNFVHVDDLVSAILCALDNPNARQQLFNICMDEPVDYGAMGAYLKDKYNLDSVGVRLPYYSNWLDNSKAKFLLDWRPVYDLARMIDSAWTYQRDAEDPRIIWYPG